MANRKRRYKVKYVSNTGKDIFFGIVITLFVLALYDYLQLTLFAGDNILILSITGIVLFLSVYFRWIRPSRVTRKFN